MSRKTADIPVGQYLSAMVDLWASSEDKSYREMILREIEDAVEALRNLDR